MLFIAIQASAAPLGRLPVSSFTPLDYEGHSQNWDVTQTADGVIFVANSEGIHSYDGVSWHLVDNPRGLRFYSVQAASDGRIYAGAAGDFGYLAADSLGTLKYRSLLDSVPPAYREFGQIRQIMEVAGSVYFQHRSYLFRLRLAAGDTGDELQVWQVMPPQTRAGFAYGLGSVDGQLHIARSGGMISVFSGGEMQDLPGSRLPDTGIVAVVAAAQSGHLLVATYRQGLWYYDGQQVRKWDTPAGRYAERERAMGIVALDGGRRLLSTLSGGASLFDADGAILRILDKSQGLPDNGVNNSALIDRGGALWLPLTYGLARVEYASPIQIFGLDDGLDGSVLSVVENGSSLFVGTTKGVFAAAAGASPAHPVRFERVARELRSPSWDMVTIGSDLFTASSTGLFRIAADGAVEQLRDGGVLSLGWSAGDNTLYVGTHQEGLHAYRLVEQRWTDAGRIEGTHDDIRHVLVIAPGDLWLHALSRDRAEFLQHVRLAGETADAVTVRTYGPEQGLPERGDLRPAWWNGGVVTGSSQGLYRHYEKLDSFVRDARVETDSAEYPAVAADGSLWFQARRGRTARLQVDAGQHRLSYPLASIRSPEYQTFHAADGAMWAGTIDGRLIRYEGQAEGAAAALPAVLVRRVGGADGSTVFAGSEPSDWTSPVLEYARHSLRFEYVLPLFSGQDKVRYQTRMVGKSADWSEWSNRTTQEYPALHEGRYRFEVRASNDAGEMTNASAFEFRLRPPWYRTWWAYLGYLLAAVLAIGALVQWFRVHELKNQIQQRELVQRGLLKYQRKLQALASEVAQAEERARRSTAEDLHDGVAQLLAVAKIRVETLRSRVDDAGEDALAEIEDLLKEAIVATRVITLELSPPMLYDLGLKPALTWLSERLREQHGLQCRFSDDGAERHIAPEMRVVLFRSVRELLQNVIKHSGVDEATIETTIDDGSVQIVVADRGIGFDVAEMDKGPDETHGFGLFHIREKISLLGGTVNIDSSAETGTRIEISVPLSGDEPEQEDWDLDLVPDLPANKRARA